MPNTRTDQCWTESEINAARALLRVGEPFSEEENDRWKHLVSCNCCLELLQHTDLAIYDLVVKLARKQE